MKKVTNRKQRFFFLLLFDYGRIWIWIWIHNTAGKEKYSENLAAENFGGAEGFLQIMSFKFHERDQPH
jgi:hypothetical protein